MKKFKFLTLTLLVLAICMTSVSATAALNPEGTYEDGVVTVTATGTDDAVDATIIATRQADELEAAPVFFDADVLATVVYIDQIDPAEEMSVSFVPARVAEGDWVNVFMAGAGASSIEIESVSLVEEEEIDRTLALNLNGGSLAEAAPEVYGEEGYTLPIPTKDVNTFLGWYANAECTGDAVTEITAAEAAIGGAKAFWAKWGENVTAFAHDAGYTAEAADAEEKEYLISVTATFGAYVGDVTNYGFYVYKNGAPEVTNDIVADGDAKVFSTVAYGIPSANIDTEVVFVPYVKVGGEFVYGAAEVLTANTAKDLEFKYLGTLANLEAQLGIDAE